MLFRRSRMSDGDETPLFYLVILVDDEIKMIQNNEMIIGGGRHADK